VEFKVCRWVFHFTFVENNFQYFVL
jgi:hypothetical protein